MSDHEPVRGTCPDCEFSGPFRDIMTTTSGERVVRCPNCKRSWDASRLLKRDRGEFFESQRHPIGSDAREGPWG